jgi:nucleoid DNA-binding protein
MTLNEIAVEAYNRLPPYYRFKAARRVVKWIVNLTFEILGDALMNGEIVVIRGFGKFTPYTYPSRKSWSHTKKTIIDSRPWMKIGFKTGSKLRRRARERLEGR